MKAKRHLVTRNQLNLSKDNIVSYLLNETARCGLSDTSLRDVAIDYFMHDSDGVFMAL